MGRRQREKVARDVCGLAEVRSGRFCRSKRRIVAAHGTEPQSVVVQTATFDACQADAEVAIDVVVAWDDEEAVSFEVGGGEEFVEEGFGDFVFGGLAGMGDVAAIGVAGANA